nr:2-hydroxy-3-oxopropionate reductase [Propionicimonas sp.]
MANIGIVGLGIMGLPMAKNLLAAGHTVTGHDRSQAAVDKLVGFGGTAAGSIADTVAGADIFITMVPDSPQVQDIVYSEGGLLESASAGLIYVDMSSIRPDVSMDVAKSCREKGIRPLDAPVSGGEPGAVAGTLSIMVGGEQADFDEVLPVLSVMGRTIVRVGPSGSGQTVKAANQLMVAVNIEALAEALLLLEAYGVDMAAAVTVLGGGLAGSAVLEQKAQKMLNREFAPGFRIDLHHKDMGIVTAAAREAGVVIPLGAVAAQLVAALRSQGDGGLDHSALLRGVERLSGRYGEK